MAKWSLYVLTTFDKSIFFNNHNLIITKYMSLIEEKTEKYFVIDIFIENNMI